MYCITPDPNRFFPLRGHGAAAVGAGDGAGLRRQAGQGRRRRRGPAGHGGRVVVPGRAAAAAAAAAGVRDARGPARDGAPGAAQRRPPPGLRGVRRAQGDRALPGRLLARLHGVPPRHPPRLTGQSLSQRLASSSSFFYLQRDRELRRPVRLCISNISSSLQLSFTVKFASAFLSLFVSAFITPSSSIQGN